jgi:hypothetical protein
MAHQARDKMLIDNVGEDISLYEFDNDRYMEIYRWGDDEIDKRRKEFMGEEFADEPKKTEFELFEKIEYHKNRAKRFQELNAPPIVIAADIQKLSDLMDEVTNKDYIRTRQEETYVKEYEGKYAEFQKDFTTHCADIIAERAEKADEFIADFRRLGDLEQENEV